MQADAVPADDAPLGSGDATRRWALRCDDGALYWPGVTRNEALALTAALADRAAADGVLAQIELGVVVSDGAGPYLVDADGTLVLVVDRHPEIDAIHIAMANTATDRVRIGAVRRIAPAAWEWVTSAELAARDRVGALDGLAAVSDGTALRDWNRTWDMRLGGPDIA